MTTIEEEEEEDCHLLLPEEITTEILFRLPVESVMQCKGVCKTWRALIDDPDFIVLYHQKPPMLVEWATFCTKYGCSDSHLHIGEYNDNNHGKMTNSFKHNKPIIYRPINTQPKTMPRKRNTVCSCKGLIFSTSILSNNMFVCNPFTREYVDLPPPMSFGSGFNCGEISLATGFGYNSYTNEYKIVMIYYYKKHYRISSAGYVTIYTLGSGRWRDKGEISPSAGYVTIYTLGSGRWRDKGEISPKLIDPSEPGVFVDGALHWLTKKKEIVSFHLADEEFRIVPSPSSSQSNHEANFVPQLGLLGGCLCVTRKRNIEDDPVESSRALDMGDRCLYINGKRNRGFQLYPAQSSTVLDIWVMENELQSWTRKFSIPRKLGGNLSADGYRPLGLSKTGKLILFHNFGKRLVSYDPETETSTVDYSFSKFSQVQIHYLKSFVSLKTLGEINADQIYDGDQKSVICECLQLHTDQIKKKKRSCTKRRRKENYEHLAMNPDLLPEIDQHKK